MAMTPILSEGRDKVVTIIAPGAGLTTNQSVFDELRRPDSGWQVRVEGQSKAHYDVYPASWQNGRAANNLETFGQGLMQQDTKLLGDCLLFGSRGGQVVLPVFWKMLRNRTLPSVVINGGCAMSLLPTEDWQHWPEEAVTLLLMGGEDFFRRGLSPEQHLLDAMSCVPSSNRSTAILYVHQMKHMPQAALLKLVLEPLLKSSLIWSTTGQAPVCHFEDLVCELRKCGFSGHLAHKEERGEQWEEVVFSTQDVRCGQRSVRTRIPLPPSIRDANLSQGGMKPERSTRSTSASPFRSRAPALSSEAPARLFNAGRLSPICSPKVTRRPQTPLLLMHRELRDDSRPRACGAQTARGGAIGGCSAASSPGGGGGGGGGSVQVLVAGLSTPGGARSPQLATRPGFSSVPRGGTTSGGWDIVKALQQAKAESMAATGAGSVVQQQQQQQQTQQQAPPGTPQQGPRVGSPNFSTTYRALLGQPLRQTSARQTNGDERNLTAAALTSLTPAAPNMAPRQAVSRQSSITTSPPTESVVVRTKEAEVAESAANRSEGGNAMTSSSWLEEQAGASGRSRTLSPPSPTRPADANGASFDSGSSHEAISMGETLTAKSAATAPSRMGATKSGHQDGGSVSTMAPTNTKGSFQDHLSYSSNLETKSGTNFVYTQPNQGQTSTTASRVSEGPSAATGNGNGASRLGGLDGTASASQQQQQLQQQQQQQLQQQLQQQNPHSQQPSRQQSSPQQTQWRNCPSGNTTPYVLMSPSSTFASSSPGNSPALTPNFPSAPPTFASPPEAAKTLARPPVVGTPNSGLSNSGLSNPGLPNPGLPNPGLPNFGVSKSGLPNQASPQPASRPTADGRQVWISPPTILPPSSTGAAAHMSPATTMTTTTTTTTTTFISGGVRYLSPSGAQSPCSTTPKPTTSWTYQSALPTSPGAQPGRQIVQSRQVTPGQQQRQLQQPLRTPTAPLLGGLATVGATPSNNSNSNNSNPIRPAAAQALLSAQPSRRTLTGPPVGLTLPGRGPKPNFGNSPVPALGTVAVGAMGMVTKAASPPSGATPAPRGYSALVSPSRTSPRTDTQQLLRQVPYAAMAYPLPQQQQRR